VVVQGGRTRIRFSVEENKRFDFVKEYFLSVNKIFWMLERLSRKRVLNIDHSI
jgi:hypothetical protein